MTYYSTTKISCVKGDYRWFCIDSKETSDFSRTTVFSGSQQFGVIDFVFFVYFSIANSGRQVGIVGFVFLIDVTISMG